MGRTVRHMSVLERCAAPPGARGRAPAIEPRLRMTTPLSAEASSRWLANPDGAPFAALSSRSATGDVVQAVLADDRHCGLAGVQMTRHSGPTPTDAALGADGADDWLLSVG